jgi:hypothetical protein
MVFETSGHEFDDRSGSGQVFIGLVCQARQSGVGFPPSGRDSGFVGQFGGLAQRCAGAVELAACFQA